MALPLPNVVFNVADRGGEYMAKLNALAVAVDQATQGVNGNAGLAATFDEYIQIIIPGYIGTWDELAGSASIGDVVYHAGSSALWRAVTAIADITASEPSGGNAAWELEGDRYATTAQGGRADAAHGWGNHASAGYAIASNLGSAAGASKVSGPGDATALALATVEWVIANASGGFKTATVRTFTSADQSGGNISVNLDCSACNFFLLDFSDASISTSGTITLNLTNFPAGSSDVVYGHIAAIRLGRKASVAITCAGKTVSWISTPSGFNSSPTGFDNVHFYTMPLNPSKLLLSLNDGRSSGYM